VTVHARESQPHPKEKSRQLQRRLYLAAKRNGQRRFHALYDRIFRPDILWRAWQEVRANGGAAGVDGVSIEEVERQGVESFLQMLEADLKAKRYRPQPVLRVHIPKPDGRQRPLGIPTVRDRVVQQACRIVVEPLFEADFLPCSFGFRPKRSAGQAVQQIKEALVRGWWVADVDIQGFFDTIDQDRLLSLVQRRISDRRVVKLIRQWLTAGVVEEGQWHPTVLGTPQGVVVSPVLANVYLHHALDGWFEEVVKTHCEGEVYLCRYADDFVCAFQYKRDAMRFHRTLGKRLDKYGLKLSAEKTRVISFSRFRKDEKTHFDFLGFEFRWGTNRMGTDQLKRRTARKRLQRSIANFTAWIKENRHRRLPGLFRDLNAKLRGYYHYYGVIGNFESLDAFLYQVKRLRIKGSTVEANGKATRGAASDRYGITSR